MVRLSLALAVLISSVAACSSDDSNATTIESSTVTSLATTTSTPPGTTSHTLVTTTTAPADTTTTAPAIDVMIEDGIVRGPDVFDSTLGHEVSIWVLSDVADQIHVHGYDLFFPAEPGIPTQIELVTDVPGIFEVEMESSHVLLFQLQVGT